jgi:hypothetical protein
VSRATPNHLLGLGVPLRYSIETFSAADTSVTEAGPRPGSAVPGDSRSELQVALSGEQSDDYTVVVLGSGMPGDVRLGYRKTSETDAATRGWNPRNALRAWRRLEYADAATATWGQATACTLPASQEVLALYNGETGTAGDSTYARRFNPATWEWGSAVEVTATNTVLAVPVVLPSGIVLSIHVGIDVAGTSSTRVYYSDDDGDTWADYASSVLRAAFTYTTVSRGRAFMVGEEMVLVWVVVTGGTTHLHQYVSTDYGMSFNRVVDWSSPGGVPEVVGLPSGRIGCVTIDGSNLPQWRSIGSPYDALDDATAVAIDASQQVAEVTAFADYDGAVYVIGRAMGAQGVYVWRSDDDGTTWVKFDFGLFDSNDGGTYPTRLHAVAVAGGALVLHQWVGAPSTADLSVSSFLCGGWSNVTTARDGGTSITDEDGARVAFGPTASSGVSTQTWVPFDLPQDCGWTLAGAATTAIVDGWLVIVSAAAQGRYTPSGGLPACQRLSAIFEVKVGSGGSLTATDIGIEASASDATYDREIEINFTTTQFRVIDSWAGGGVGATIGEVTTDTTQPLFIRIEMDVSSINITEVYWQRPGAQAWTLVYSGPLTLAGAISGIGHLRFGHCTAAPTVESSWRLVAWGAGFTDQQWASSASSSTLFDAPTGKAIGLLPYPLGDIATDGASFLTACDGPGRIDEAHSIEVAHDHGVEKVFPDVSPSTADQWRSTSTAEQIIAVVPSALGSGTDTVWSAKSLFLAVVNANFRTAYLEGYTGAAWVQLGEYDAATGFTGLTAAVSGDVVTPNGGIASRYLQRAELVGGTAIVNGTYAEILQQEEGLWTTATTRKPRIIVDRAVGAGACTLVAHSGLLVIHNITTGYRKYRVRIPSQTTKDGDIRAGLIVVGGLQMVGLSPSDGWAMDWDPRYREAEDDRGTTRREDLGPLQRTVALAWSEGVPLLGIRSGTPNYVSADAAHDPAGTHKDVPLLMAGLLAESKSGRLPMVVVQRVPEVATYTTITDPTLWMLARPQSPVSMTQVLGKPGAERLVRVQQMQFRELR